MNHFERFGLAPHPWIDQDLLKDKFLNLSAELHPDKAGGATGGKAFQNLNNSYNALRHTRARLIHLLELSGEPPQEHVQSVPSEAMEFFSTVAEATRRADTLLKEKASTSSPMLKVQWMERSLEETGRLQELQARLRGRIETIEASLRGMDWAWPAPDAARSALRQAVAALGFLERWNSQLGERLSALVF